MVAGGCGRKWMVCQSVRVGGEPAWLVGALVTRLPKGLDPLRLAVGQVCQLERQIQV